MSQPRTFAIGARDLPSENDKRRLACLKRRERRAYLQWCWMLRGDRAALAELNALADLEADEPHADMEGPNEPER